MSINILRAFNEEPPPLEFLWDGGPLLGSVAALISQGGVGKSFFALEAAMAIADQRADILDLKPNVNGGVLYVSLEDSSIILKRRLFEIGQILDDDTKKSVARNLRIWQLFGSEVDIMDSEGFWCFHIIEEANRLLNPKLVILDTLSRAHSFDENNNGQMARVVSKIEKIAKETEATILFLHHISKASALNPSSQQSARGASSLIDNARWCAQLTRMTEEESKQWTDRHYDRSTPIGDRRKYFLKMSVVKSNYSMIPPDMWFERVPGGVLKPADYLKRVTKDKKNETKREREQA